MLINAFCFVVFLVFSLLLFYKSNKSLWVLFFFNCLFLSFFEWTAIPVILANSWLTFYVAKKIAFSAHKNTWFVLALSVNVLQFFVFKLYNETSLFTAHTIAFTLGFSFYVLQNMAYLFDVRMQKNNAETDLLNYMVYSSFFPKVLSGPIVLYQNIKEELVKKPVFKKENLYLGFNRLLLGLFKKIVLADALAPMIASVFNATENTHGFTSLVGGAAFTLHLYFDFSAYADISLAISRFFGITLPENFLFPFQSKSIGEFWRRWHAPLMEWFATYIYLPLTFYTRSLGVFSSVLGIVAVFACSSVWHGVGVTFLIWALCHVVYLIVELFAEKRKIKLPGSLAVFFTFCAVCFANIFFRSPNMLTVKKIINEIFINDGFWPHQWNAGFVAVFARGGETQHLFNWYILLFFSTVYLLFERKIYAVVNDAKINIVYVVLILIFIAVFGVFSANEQFIYARF